MTTPISARDANQRRGFTLVELLVVIAIIGTLVALLLPAVQTARATARQNTCLSNIKQLALGIVNYESTKQQYPGYVQSFKRDQTSPQQYLRIDINRVDDATLESTDLPDQSRVSWAAVIMPQLERNDIYDAMVDHDVRTGGSLSAQSPIGAVAVLMCPSDDELTSIAENAGLSYSANTGTWDWYDTSGNLATPPSSPFNRATYEAIAGDTKANGIFHNRTLGRLRLSMSTLSTGDGASNTILLSENIHKEIDQSTPDPYTWAGVNLDSAGEQQLGICWVAPEIYSTTPTATDSPFGVSAANSGQAPFSNDGEVVPFVTTAPFHARPASNHATGVFNTAFADGSGRSISPDIDYSVYQRLMTVEGRKCVEPVNNNDSVYQNQAPLAAGDF